MKRPEYDNLKIEAKARIELANLFLKLDECRFYQFEKKRKLRNHIDLIISAYAIEILPYI